MLTSDSTDNTSDGHTDDAKSEVPSDRTVIQYVNGAYTVCQLILVVGQSSSSALMDEFIKALCKDSVVTVVTVG